MNFLNAGQSLGILANQESEYHAKEAWPDVTGHQVIYLFFQA